MTRLLDRNDAVSLLGLVLVALGLGAAHALQPGHGKTLVAAAVLGEGGTWWRGVSLALITTLTHTGSVLLVALGLWWSRTQRYGAIHLVLAHAAGVVIAAIGLWRLGRHLGGFGEHDSPPGDVCLEEGVRAGAVAGRGVIALGIGGGLVPCWDAVVLIVLAEATGRLGLGIALLLAFGLGMALVLVAVGLLAGRIRQRLVRIRGVEAYGPWERGLGLAGGLVLAAIGIYLIGLT